MRAVTDMRASLRATRFRPARRALTFAHYNMAWNQNWRLSVFLLE